MLRLVCWSLTCPALFGGPRVITTIQALQPSASDSRRINSSHFSLHLPPFFCQGQQRELRGGRTAQCCNHFNFVFFFLLVYFLTYTVTVRCCNRLRRLGRGGRGGNWLFVSTHTKSKSFVSSKRGQLAVAQGRRCFGGVILEFDKPACRSPSPRRAARFSQGR